MELVPSKVERERSPRFGAWVIQCHIAETSGLAERAAIAGRAHDKSPRTENGGANSHERFQAVKQ
jgi:hypothetical protein